MGFSHDVSTGSQPASSGRASGPAIICRPGGPRAKWPSAGDSPFCLSILSSGVTLMSPVSGSNVSFKKLPHHSCFYKD